MKINAFVTALLTLFALLSDSEGRAQSILDKAVPALKDWSKQYPVEKVHLHLDKPYYLAGDTIWMKAYTVVGADNNLSALSGAVYVDLFTDADSLISSLKLPLLGGMAKGSIDIAKELPAGNYRLRAYTQWMRNMDPEYFYDHSFLIGALSTGQSRALAQFKFEDGKKDGVVNTELIFKDQSSKPLAGKEVTYQLQTLGERFQTGRGTTNDEGKILISLKAPKGIDTINAVLASQIKLGSKEIENHVFPVKSTFESADIQFFPESGDLIAGLPSRVGFKAVGSDGTGMSVTGVILDDAQNEVAELNSVHLGMGIFPIQPQAGKKYQARVTFADKSTKTIDLPEVKEQGRILAVYPAPANDSLLVQILSSKDNLNAASLIVQKAGEVLYAVDLAISKTMTLLRIPTAEFPAGVVHLTLFDKQGRPTNERLTFIEKKDSLLVNVDQQEYKTRGEVTLDIKPFDRSGKSAVANFSIAVLDETSVPVDERNESTIYSELLLRSEIKGYIEKPNYYFLKQDNETRDYLDLLMMTQGYRRFSWNELLAGKVTPPIYAPEKLTSKITGRLLTLFGKPVPNGRITLLTLAPKMMLDTLTDVNGRFEFNNLVLANGLKFTVQGKTAKNSDKVEIVLDAVSGMPSTPNKNFGDISLKVLDSLSAPIVKAIEQDNALSRLGLTSRIINLKEVSISANRNQPLPKSGNMNGAGRADQVVSGNDLLSCLTLRACLEGRLRGVRFVSEQTSIGTVSFPVSTRGGKMVVSIDSRILDPTNSSDLSDIVGLFDQNLIDPTQILSIEVLRSPSFTNIYGAVGQGGVIVINTKGWTPGQRSVFNVKNFTPRGFTYVREYYAPKYGISEILDAQADFRSLIYWNPALSTTADGKASVKFFNAGQPGTYRVVVEGISSQGQLLRKVIRYKVN